MIAPGSEVRIYVALQPVDFRKGSEEDYKTVRGTVLPTNGLAMAVQETLGLVPFCGAVFVFREKRADRVNILVWDQTGIVLVHKRLEAGTFVWPRVRDGVMTFTAAQFSALFEGLDWRLMRSVETRRPQVAG